MTPEEIRLLFAYDAWANARDLEACAALTPEQFTRALGSSFTSVRDTLAHILGAQWIWNERFHGRATTSLPKNDQYPDIASLRAGWAGVEGDLGAFVEKLSVADLDRSFEYRDSKGNPHRNILGETLQHLANHGTYHRGQVTTLLRQLGAKPVSTDLIAFYRERASQTAK
jgi:uncharacterized damage-inducible protein DinB